MFKNKSVQSVVNKVMGRVAPVAGYAVKGVGALTRANTPTGNPSNAGLAGALKGAKKIKKLK